MFEPLAVRRWARAQTIIEQWRQEYNHHRPHSSSGYLPPTTFAEKSGLVPGGRSARLKHEYITPTYATHIFAMAINNQFLFSQLFFEQIRRETADLDNLRTTLGTIRDTWQFYLPSPLDVDGRSWQPSQTIDEHNVSQLSGYVIEPIFGYLELVYAPCKTDDRAFFLYGDWEQKDCTGLCLVLPYGSHIEGRDLGTGRVPKGRNHAQQLIRLLRQNDLEWGVLTNGRFWRLYHRSELSPTDTYLEVDLGKIIVTEAIQDYIVFHRFFSRSAFIRENGQQRLDLYKGQSDEATGLIEKHLTTQVEEIVRYLSQGLVESCRQKHEDISSRDTRSTIYQNALFLVYRLLFVLYAEARDLLPLDNPTYAAVCLRDLLNQLRKNHADGLSYDDEYAMWRQLQNLFALIDQGDTAAGVPAYNGGLFDPSRRPFLTEHRIGNIYLQAALLRLAFLPAKGKSYDQDQHPQLIDYRDLSVRHLGSLYEGLLEFNLFVVQDEVRVVRASKNNTRYVPISQAGKVRSSETVLQIGDVYFSETEGERKVTGSYYTPEDVVDYIVRNTVGHVLQERWQHFVQKRDIQRQKRDLADIPPDIPAHGQIQRAIDNQYQQFVHHEILNLRVLDPAMGSGHFLVNVTHAIANFIVDLLNETEWENSEIDTDVANWKRQVVERCIFGVDLNELAVELAKLCLWMTTTAKGKPLTFVDHHLRRGNSLVGAWIKDVGTYPLAQKEREQAFTLPMEYFQIDLQEILAAYQELYAKDQDNVTEVRQKARVFDEEIMPRLQAYRELLILHTGIFFGYDLDDSVYAQLGLAVKSAAQWAKLKEELYSQLQKASRNNWFHWQLEYIEAFGADDPNTLDGGFDVILGNPPYASYPTSLSLRFLENQYMTAASGDLYALFMERAIQTTRTGRSIIGFIVPLSITFSSRLTSLRHLFFSQNRRWEIVSFDKRPQSIFPNVQQRTSIVFGKYSPNDSPQVYSGPLLRWRPEERKNLFRSLKTYHCAQPTLELGIPKLGSDLQGHILNRLLSDGGQAKKHFADTRGIEELNSDELERFTVHFFGVAYRWLVSAKKLPPSVSPEGHPVHLTGFSTLRFKDESTAWAYMGIMNGLIAYWFWLVYGDSFHVTQSLLGSLPVDISALDSAAREQLVEFAKELQHEMDKHVFYNTMQGRVTANYNLLQCRHITEKIDRLLVHGLHLGEDFYADITAFCTEAAGE